MQGEPSVRPRRVPPLVLAPRRSRTAGGGCGAFTADPSGLGRSASPPVSGAQARSATGRATRHRRLPRKAGRRHVRMTRDPAPGWLGRNTSLRPRAAGSRVPARVASRHPLRLVPRPPSVETPPADHPVAPRQTQWIQIGSHRQSNAWRCVVGTSVGNVSGRDDGARGGADGAEKRAHGAADSRAGGAGRYSGRAGCPEAARPGRTGPPRLPR